MSKPLKWLTQGEEQVTFSSDGNHVMEDIRAEVKRILIGGSQHTDVLCGD